MGRAMGRAQGLWWFSVYPGHSFWMVLKLCTDAIAVLYGQSSLGCDGLVVISWTLVLNGLTTLQKCNRRSLWAELTGLWWFSGISWTLVLNGLKTLHRCNRRSLWAELPGLWWFSGISWTLVLNGLTTLQKCNRRSLWAELTGLWWFSGISWTHFLNGLKTLQRCNRRTLWAELSGLWWFSGISRTLVLNGLTTLQRCNRRTLWAELSGLWWFSGTSRKRPARTYKQQLCADTGCNPEDLPEAKDDREGWRERIGNIHVDCLTWRWWWWSLCRDAVAVFYGPSSLGSDGLVVYLGHSLWRDLPLSRDAVAEFYEFH